MVVLALGVAEGKLIWYSYTKRDLHTTVQGLLLDERARLAGRSVFRYEWNRADRFVLVHIVGAQPRIASDEADFLLQAGRRDYLLLTPDEEHSRLQSVRRTRRHLLCERRD